jgi:tetratricopeptide (TPR) repeat protein
MKGKILLLGIGNAPVRYRAIPVIYENFLKVCRGLFEIITFGYNAGVDIHIHPGDKFEKVIEALPDNWVPDLCILPIIDYNLLPRGIESAPFRTVAITSPGDWDFDVIYTKRIVESVDMVIGEGDYDKVGLESIGANAVELFYPNTIMREFFDPNPKKIKDREYDIFYTATWFEDESHSERSNWLLRLISLATKYKILITHHLNFNVYIKMLRNSKLAFSTVRTGVFSGRVLDAAAQGTIPVVTGREITKHFVPGEEIINVNENNFAVLIDQFLKDEETLQKMSDNVYKKAMKKFESKKRFFWLIRFAQEKLDSKKFVRKKGGFSVQEKHIRRGEVYYYAYFRSIRTSDIFVDHRPEKYARLCIEEFEKAVNIKRSARSLTNLAVAKIAFGFCCNGDGMVTEEIKEGIRILKDVISSYPSYIIAYYHLGLVYLRTRSYAEAKDIFSQTLNLFEDKENEIDIWCLQNRDTEYFNKIIWVPLNRELLLYHNKGEKRKAMENIRNLYRSAILYYLSLLEEDIFKKLEFLAQSYILHPNSGLISHELAKVLSLLGYREEGIRMYEHTISLLPLDIDKRIEYIKLLYFYGMDKKVTDEIKSLSYMIKMIPLLRTKKVDLEKMIGMFLRLNIEIDSLKDLNEDLPFYLLKERLDELPLKGLDDRINLLKYWRGRIKRLNLPREYNSYEIVHEWIDTLYGYLNKSPKDLRLVIRIIELWNEMGQIDKILEILEDYIAINLKEGCKGDDLLSVLRDIYDYLEKEVKVEKKIMIERFDKIKRIIAQVHVKGQI